MVREGRTRSHFVVAPPDLAALLKARPDLIYLLTVLVALLEGPASGAVMGRSMVTGPTVMGISGA